MSFAKLYEWILRSCTYLRINEAERSRRVHVGMKMADLSRNNRYGIYCVKIKSSRSYKNEVSKARGIKFAQLL